MLRLVVRRLLWMIPTLLAVSIISFAIIQLPPGDYLTSHIAALSQTGAEPRACEPVCSCDKDGFHSLIPSCTVFTYCAT